MKAVLTGMREGIKTQERFIIREDRSEQNREMNLITVFPQMRYQTIQGFGGALTDAAGHVYSLMSEADRAEMIRTYFDPKEMNYTWGRTSIDSCDFSSEMYAADNDPEDPELSKMDYTRAEKNLLPLLRDAEKAAGQPLKFMLTPWTPPAWMKTNQSRTRGGFLREECAPLWAEYICRYTEHCLARGMDVRLLSVQNEPQAVQTWDSCIYSGEQEAQFIRFHLLPALKRHGLDERLGLLIWDHNKEKVLERACTVMRDGDLKRAVAGIAFHWYSGDHFENLRMAGELFPGKRLVFSEGCVEHSVWGTGAELTGAVHYAHEYIGDLNAGADTFLDWNLLLDEKGGPNHVKNYCDAPMMYDTVHHQLKKNLSLDYIGHFSRYIRPGAVRLGVSRYTADIEAAAALNPDGGIAAVALNVTDREVRFWLQVGEKYWPVTLPAGAVITCVTEEGDLPYSSSKAPV